MFDRKNIKRSYLIGIRKIRNFLLSDQSREFLVFLFFVFVSFCFWLLQTLNDTYQTEFRMPIRLRNIPKEVVMTSEFPDDIWVRVEDRGTVLLNYMLGKTFFPVSFDFQDYQGMGEHVLISPSDVTKKVSAQLNTTTKLLSVNPDTLDFIYTEGRAKKIPVAVSGQIAAGRQYYISNVKLSPDSVMVYAPDDVLKSLTTIYTQPLSQENITDTVKNTVRLQKIKGAKFSPSSTDVTVCVDMYSEKTVEVPVVGLNFPPGKVLRTFPSKVQVAFQVGLKDFKSVSEKDFFIAVSYDDLKDSKSDKTKVSLRSVPGCVSHVRILPKTVDFLIEQQAFDSNMQ